MVRKMCSARPSLRLVLCLEQLSVSEPGRLGSVPFMGGCTIGEFTCCCSVLQESGFLVLAHDNNISFAQSS